MKHEKKTAYHIGKGLIKIPYILNVYTQTKSITEN